MNQTSKTIGKLLKFSGPFRITILLSAVFSAFSAVINLKAYLCVYGVAKVLIQSSGNFGALDLAAMKALGMQAVWYVCMGFGVYGMALLCSHISAYTQWRGYGCSSSAISVPCHWAITACTPAGSSGRSSRRTPTISKSSSLTISRTMCSLWCCPLRFWCSCSGMTGGCRSSALSLFLSVSFSFSRC